MYWPKKLSQGDSKKPLSHNVGLKGGEHADKPAEKEDEVEEQGGPNEQLSMSDVVKLTANVVPNGM